MGCRQMGQRVEREGRGRVRMGRRDVEEIGGVGLRAGVGWGGSGAFWVGVEEERETVFGR